CSLPSFDQTVAGSSFKSSKVCCALVLSRVFTCAEKPALCRKGFLIFLKRVIPCDLFIFDSYDFCAASGLSKCSPPFGHFPGGASQGAASPLSLIWYFVIMTTLIKDNKINIVSSSSYMNILIYK